MNPEMLMDKWMIDHIGFYQQRMEEELENAKKRYRDKMNPRKKELDEREKEIVERESQLLKKERQLQNRLDEIERLFKQTEQEQQDYVSIVNRLRDRMKRQFTETFPFIVLTLDYDVIKEKLDVLSMNVLKILPEHIDELKKIIERKMFERI